MDFEDALVIIEEIVTKHELNSRTIRAMDALKDGFQEFRFNLDNATNEIRTLQNVIYDLNDQIEDLENEL